MFCAFLFNLFLHSLLQLISPVRTDGMMQVAYCAPKTTSRHGDLATHDLCTSVLHVSAGKPNFLQRGLQRSWIHKTISVSQSPVLLTAVRTQQSPRLCLTY